MQVARTSQSLLLLCCQTRSAQSQQTEFSSLLCDGKQAATRNSLQNSQFDLEEKKHVSVRASSYKLSPQGYSFSLGHCLSLPGGVKCILVDIKEWLAAPLS